MKTSQALAALAALSHISRLTAFRALVQAGPAGLPVGAVRERLGIPAATLSAHLNVLRAAGLVSDLREGRVIRVSADFAQMDALLGYLTDNCCGGTPCGSAASVRSGRGVRAARSVATSKVEAQSIAAQRVAPPRAQSPRVMAPERTPRPAAADGRPRAAARGPQHSGHAGSAARKRPSHRRGAPGGH